MKIGVDARKILRNATGLGNYGRTLVCNMSELIADNDRLLLFSPDAGKPALKAISIPQKVSWWFLQTHPSLYIKGGGS